MYEDLVERLARMRPEDRPPYGPRRIGPEAAEALRRRHHLYDAETRKILLMQ